VLISAAQTSLGRTSAPCDTLTQACSLDLRGFLQLNNREMSAACEVRHDQRDPLATPPSHPCRRPGARRSSWPLSSRLKPWCLRSWQAIKVDLIESRSEQTAVRSMAVVPLDEQTNLTAKRSAIRRHENATKRLAFHGPHQPLDYRDAAVLLDGPESRNGASSANLRARGRILSPSRCFGNRPLWCSGPPNVNAGIWRISTIG